MSLCKVHGVGVEVSSSVWNGKERDGNRQYSAEYILGNCQVNESETEVAEAIKMGLGWGVIYVYGGWERGRRMVNEEQYEKLLEVKTDLCLNLEETILTIEIPSGD